MSEKNRTKTESEIKDEQKRNHISPSCVLLYLLAGVLAFLILNMDCLPLVSGDDVRDRWIAAFYFLIIPLTLMGIACGLPYYKNKDAVVFGLLLNVFLLITCLIIKIADLCYHFG